MEKPKTGLDSHTAPKTPLKLLRLELVKATTGLCKSQIYLLQKQKKFPASVCLSGNRGENGKRGGVAWIDHEVQAWIESRVKASRPTEDM